MNCESKICVLENLQTVTFTFMHLADAFIQSDLHCIQVTVLHLISSCFPWEVNSVYVISVRQKTVLACFFFFLLVSC